MIKKLVLAAVLVSLTGSMIACNTTEGLGKDTKHAGQAIENAADRNK